MDANEGLDWDLFNNVHIPLKWLHVLQIILAETINYDCLHFYLLKY